MLKRPLKPFIEQKLGKIPCFLIHTLLEWVLIIMLFVDGLIAFACNEFARFFELRIPCLFCTRIDHVMVHRDPDFYYNDSICETHRKDVSSLAYCHVHQKLADIRRMCEGCLLSFATEDKSDSDTYRSLVGILGKDLECSVEEDHKIHLRLPAGGKMDILQFEKSNIHRCSCCGEALRIRASFPQGLVQNVSSNEIHFPQAPAPSPRGLLVKPKLEERSRGSDTLPHIPYTELKISSDSESEIPEDEDGSTSLTSENQCREDVHAATVPLLVELNDDACKTPTFKGSRLSAVTIAESATISPRWLHKHPKRLAIEKPETEFVEESTTTEVDAETILHRLKRQVRLDRKSLITLYMELDEERNASAIAANQAMAMITRLQAEKAAVQMEALQYQRMMEEQAEYDQEALQDIKDLLIKREEEIKVLEAELETYREKSVLVGDADEDYHQLKSASESSVSAHCECGSPPDIIDVEEGNGEHEHNSDGPPLGSNGRKILEEPLLDIEDEKLYLLDQLKMLEKRIHLSTNDGDNLLPSSYINNLNEEDKGEKSSDTITEEISRLSEKLEALEADREFLKHAVQSLRKGGEGTQLLREIALHLRELRCAEKMPMDGIAA
ncbi:probable myosin-binding protein 5 isoform X4 [Macadamia integrifolia]|uniref:probable myosin-binding protein 5 isoform X3 n=1 Tax=Macadamia integrifolia TaxID=60698 RepID=UPI001C4FE03A|nr:probable myosin-binding protein 5 isoform X3 [Macadamia integrifolia]XP_042502148.1 probable myosin-binding protein 5 isoform X4 [Macadamia integrifolia]